MKKLLYLLIIFVLLGIFVYFSNNTLYINELSLRSTKIKHSFVILHLSDLHGKRIDNFMIDFKGKVDKINPDLVLITGDTIANSKEESLTYPSYLKNVLSNHPTYFVSGNHEVYHYDYVNEFVSQMKKQGFIYLDDAYQVISIANNSIMIAGIADPNFTENFQISDFANQIKVLESKNDKFKILLSHRAELAKYYLASSFDLILSGHTHGGVIRLPFSTVGLYASGQGVFPHYDGGFYENKFVVNRGVGNKKNTLRLFNPPEIVKITIN